MTVPAYLLFFWLLYAVFVTPAACFSSTAAVLWFSRMALQLSWNTGLPEPQTEWAVYALSAVVALWYARTEACIAIGAIFFPLLITSIAQWAGAVSPDQGYWLIYALAMMQIVLLPFCIDWKTVKEGIDAIKDMSWLDHLMRIRPWTS